MCEFPLDFGSATDLRDWVWRSRSEIPLKFTRNYSDLRFLTLSLTFSFSPSLTDENQ